MSNTHSQKYSNEMIIAALAALANAPTWEMTYQVLTTKAEILTSDMAFAYLCEIISMHRSLREIAEVDNWNSYLGLLEDVRKSNVEEAWSNFSTLQNESAEAIEFFIGATKEEKRKFLVTDTPLLLSNPAFVYLRNKVEVAQAENDAELVELLEPHLHLLEDARAHNINAAWTNWENYM
ncbi:MAG TPA: hypothetical protein VKU38_18530, partial [Ktedonobacteraceae bacterium]|nr:hypothetical protein [Ktedonobacteraceae bacterium]